ncbi:MAG: hypothetical protein LBT64_03875, partial [Puniceicoccales bacterium]|nr:hypothetical protein [Puniceicoccales bacterium]
MINGSEQVSASKPSDGIEKTEAANSSDIRMVNTELPNVQKKTGEKVPTENYTETQNTQSSVAEITKNTTGSVDAHGHGTATSIKTKAVTAQQSVNAAESAASAQISEAGTKVAADSGSSEVQQSANLYSRYEAFIDRMIGKITDSTIFKLIIRPALKAIGIDEKIFCEFLKQIFLLAGIAVIVAAASLAISLAFSPLAAAIVCGVAFLLYIAWATANAVILKGELEQAAAIVESNKKTIEEQRTSIGEQAENINALGEQNKELNQSVENLEKINADLESAQEDLKNINAQLSALSEKQKESNVALEKSNENMQNSIDNLKKEAES